MSMMDRLQVRSWDTPSKSRPGKSYRTTQWSDGTYSCDCPAWTFKKAGEQRTCRHVEGEQPKLVKIMPLKNARILINGVDISQQDKSSLRESLEKSIREKERAVRRIPPIQVTPIKPTLKRVADSIDPPPKRMIVLED